MNNGDIKRTWDVCGLSMIEIYLATLSNFFFFFFN